MTDLNRKALLAELNDILHRNEAHLTSKGPVSTATAQARHEMAYTLKTDIENGRFDIVGSSARDFYLSTLRARWDLLTPRQRKQIDKIDRLLKISISQLAHPRSVGEGTPTEPITLSTPKSTSSPWKWPLVALGGLLIVVLGGTLAALFL